MPDFTIAELNENTGEATADGLRNVANVAANAICSAWRNYAGATSGFPDPTGIAAFNNGVFSRLCEPRGVQAPVPSEEFLGGQCPIDYDVTVSIGSANPGEVGGTFPPNSTPFYPRIRGPIRGGAVLDNAGGGKRGVFFAAPSQAYPDGIITTWTSPNTGQEGYFDGAFSTVLSVVPSDPNQPDICGNPAPTFPPIVPPIDVFDFDTSVYIGGPSIDVNVSFNPVIFAPLTLIKPEINVQVGPFQVVFDAGGVNIYVNPQSDPTITLPPGLDPRPDRPTPKPPTGGGGGGDCPDCICLPTDLTEVNEKLDDIIDCVCVDEQFLTQSFAGARGNLYTTPTWVKTAILDVVDIGDAVRGQLGEGGAPDVYYLGWAAFGKGSRLGQRFPVSFGSNKYVNLSEDIDSFAYSLNFGSVGTVVLEYLKPED